MIDDWGIARCLLGLGLRCRGEVPAFAGNDGMGAGYDVLGCGNGE